MEPNTTQLQIWLDLARDGDAGAREKLFDATCQRLRAHVRHMLRDDRLHSWEQTDDVLQQTMTKLFVGLKQYYPATIRQYFWIAGRHVRQALRDLARHYFGPHGMGTNQLSPQGAGPTLDELLNGVPAEGMSPSQIAGQREMYERLFAAVEQLPDDEREIFELLYVHGVKQLEAAALLQISHSTLERRWKEIRQKLAWALRDLFS